MYRSARYHRLAATICSSRHLLGASSASVHAFSSRFLVLGSYKVANVALDGLYASRILVEAGQYFCPDAVRLFLLRDADVDRGAASVASLH